MDFLCSRKDEDKDRLVHTSVKITYEILNRINDINKVENVNESWVTKLLFKLSYHVLF